MTDHTKEPWQESTGEPDFKTNWPEELGYLKPSDKTRAVTCVNKCAGLTEQEIKEAIEGRGCRHCESLNPQCQCWNDE
jgi:hypothetical protein